MAEAGRDLAALIVAAGRGTRAGLPYPKTLFAVGGQPILLRIMARLAPYDRCPTVVVSPAGEAPVRDALAQAGMCAHCVVQAEPLGMGHAVLQFAASPARAAEHVLLVWGDIALLRPETVAGLVAGHFAQGNDFTFVSRQVDAAYTVVERDPAGRVIALTETREAGLVPAPGERDVGLFLFRRAPVFAALAQDLPGKVGAATGEHGFLYVVRHLAARGLKVAALPIGAEADLISFNQLADLADVARWL